MFTSLQIIDRGKKEPRIVAELPESMVAILTQRASYDPEVVGMVDVRTGRLWVESGAANRTLITLFFEELGACLHRETVRPSKILLPRVRAVTFWMSRAPSPGAICGHERNFRLPR
jgi:hypothetical protein